ncbi:cyclase family protein [Maricurvus nonylphenolicus]|uniref:cyclase family protein n=1 Tax=Maricurvus nonylphenolicus TaxID=1008307 RepID=UPI0036F1E556
MQVVDLSKPIQYNREDPFFMRVKIRHKPHWIARWIVRLMGLPFRLMPKDFVGWADDTITQMGVHSTTHIDAPWHYGPKNGTQKAASVEDIPLNECIGPGVVIDMTHKAEGDSITAEDLIQSLDKTGSELQPGSIVLIHTGRDEYMGTKLFWKKGTGMSAEATEWLIDQGITVMGIDQWGWDLPFHYQIQQAKQQNRDDLFWEGHRIGQHKPYWQMEQLTNLSSLPSHGFKVCVFPLKIVGASAAPARVVALLE